MLEVVQILPIGDEPRISIDLYQPVNVDWKHGYPIAWWTICPSDEYYLMIGYECPSGRLISLETPAYQEHVELDGPCWNMADSIEGHPLVAVKGAEWKSHVDPIVRSFEIEHSRHDLKIRWAADVRSLRSGRCMFGLDERNCLASIGVIEMTVEESDVLRRGLNFRQR